MNRSFSSLWGTCLSCWDIAWMACRHTDDNITTVTNSQWNVTRNWNWNINDNCTSIIVIIIISVLPPVITSEVAEEVMKLLWYYGPNWEYESPSLDLSTSSWDSEEFDFEYCTRKWASDSSCRMMETTYGKVSSQLRSWLILLPLSFQGASERDSPKRAERMAAKQPESKKAAGDAAAAASPKTDSKLKKRVEGDMEEKCISK